MEIDRRSSATKGRFEANCRHDINCGTKNVVSCVHRKNHEGGGLGVNTLEKKTKGSVPVLSITPNTSAFVPRQSDGNEPVFLFHALQFLCGFQYSCVQLNETRKNELLDNSSKSPRPVFPISTMLNLTVNSNLVHSKNQIIQMICFIFKWPC